MVLIQNKRLMWGEGIDYDVPNLNDFMFFGGGGGKGGSKTVYIKPKAPEQAPASKLNDTDVNTDVATGEDDGLIGGSRNKSLGGTRKLAIPVTASR